MYRAFSLTWPAAMQIYWNKRKFLHKKKVGRRFIVLGHQYGCRDVMCEHSLEMLRSLLHLWLSLVTFMVIQFITFMVKFYYIYGERDYYIYS